MQNLRLRNWDLMSGESSEGAGSCRPCICLVDLRDFCCNQTLSLHLLLPMSPNVRNLELMDLIQCLSTFCSVPCYLCRSQWLLNLWETCTNQYYNSVLMPLVQQPYAQIFSPESQKSVNKNDKVSHKCWFQHYILYVQHYPLSFKIWHFCPSYKKCEHSAHCIAIGLSLWPHTCCHGSKFIWK